MQQKIKHILFDCERMKYEHTGIYHYCLQMGQALLKKANEQKEKFHFYVPKSSLGIFGSEVKYIQQHPLHKFWLPSVDCDIWHCTYQNSMYFPFRFKRPVVFTVHDLNFLHEESITVKQRKKYLKQFEKKAARADHIIFISRFTREDVMRVVNIEKKPYSIVYNASGFTGEEQPTLPKWVPQGEFIFTVGTIVDKKNFHVLPCLLVNNNLQLVIAGITQSEEYKAKIINEAKKHNVADRIVFTGSISENDKIWYIKNCEAFLFPSIAEGFGKPVVEAMQFGKPLFLSTHTSLPEIGGDIAFYFDNFDPMHMQERFAEGVKYYKDNTSLREAILERASIFNWENSAKKYLEIYRSFY